MLTDSLSAFTVRSEGATCGSYLGKRKEGDCEQVYDRMMTHLCARCVRLSIEWSAYMNMGMVADSITSGDQVLRW